MKRMGRKSHKHVPLSLTSLMDVFTNLVFFLLLSQGVATVDEPPKSIKLPDSYTDTKGHASVNMLVSNDQVMIQGEAVATTAEILSASSDLVPAVRERLLQIRGTSVAISAGGKDDNHEVTILANNTIPFKVMKRLMASCTSAGYSKISLAVRENSGVTAPPKRS